MEHLTNAFSVLELDAGDDRLPASDSASATAAAQSSENGGASSSGSKQKKANGSNNNALGKIEKQIEVTAALPEYKLPLVWIDLEMTGRICCS
ncbi:hypothetical protein CRG98_039303 [Punica granatum]|uniref:Exonuclease domain-containing protein n=1 Tax=Punica granatum TaxID=22663 RepID=A0A2I0I8F0_PUNGR|nr:hypothetical protein CRG98_039303 [Punica granatum]